jgi:hypothetical protein
VRITEQRSLLTGLRTCKEADVWSLGLSPVVLIRAYALLGTRLRVDSKYSTDNQIFSQAILKFPARSRRCGAATLTSVVAKADKRQNACCCRPGNKTRKCPISLVRRNHTLWPLAIARSPNPGDIPCKLL